MAEVRIYDKCRVEADPVTPSDEYINEVGMVRISLKTIIVAHGGEEREVDLCHACRARMARDYADDLDKQKAHEDLIRSEGKARQKFVEAPSSDLAVDRVS